MLTFQKQISLILSTLKKSPENLRAIQTAGFYLHNLLQYPKEPKFSTINTANKGYVERVSQVPAAEKILEISGFRKYDDGFLRRNMEEKEQDFAELCVLLFSSTDVIGENSWRAPLIRCNLS